MWSEESVKVNDDLLLRAKAGSNAAFSELAEIYSPLVDSMVDRYRSETVYSLESEDLRQEAVIALYGAVKAYNIEQSDVTFGLFAKICIRNRFVGIIRKQRGRSNSRSDLFDQELSSSDPEQNIIDRENYERLTKVIDESLTEYEKSVFKLFILNKSYREIACALERDVKSVDNAVCRIKKKLKQRI